MPEVSIVIKGEDRYSSAVKAMSSVTKSFRKDQEQLERTMLRLTENQHKLRTEYDTSRKTLKELEAQYATTGDEALKMAADSERLKMDNIKRNLDLVSRGAASARREMEKAGDAFSRVSSKGEHAIGGLSDIMKALAASGFGQMAGQLVQSAATSLFASALGNDAGTMFSSSVSSAISGAAMGTAILGPGVGTAVGAALGGVIGVGTGALQNWEKKDDYFKAYYNGIIDQQAQERAAAIQSGSGIAAGRETDLISFSTLFGSEDVAKGYLSDLVDMANTTPFLYSDLTAMSKTLATYGYGNQDILPALTKIGDAGAALGMGTSDMSMVATALGRMKSSDKATLEYLNILNDRGIGAVGMLAEAKNMSVGDTYDAISKGKITGGEAVDIILSALESSYGGSMVKQSQTFSGLSSTLEGLQQEMQNAHGEGYNEVREEGIRAEIDSYSGALGGAMQDLNEATGALAAYRENLQERYTREALEGLMLGKSSDLFTGEQGEALKDLGDRYQKASQEYANGSKEAAVEMGYLKEQAEALAQAAYDNSDWAKEELTAEQENTKAIRELTGRLSEGILLKYQVEQEGTKGMGAVTGGYQSPASTYLNGQTYRTGTASDYATRITYKDDGAPDVTSINVGDARALAGWRPHAAGLQRVPYDDYLALLHEGERVLTAREVREADADGGMGGAKVINLYVDMSGEVNIRGDDDLDGIAERLADKIILALDSGTF